MTQFELSEKLQTEYGFKKTKITANSELIGSVIACLSGESDLTELMKSYVSDGLAFREKAYAASEEVEKKRRELWNREDKCARIERKNKALESEIAAVRQEMENIREAIADAETTEMRDRLRLYFIFKTDFEKIIESPQNKSMFIHGASEILCGHSIPFDAKVVAKE